MAKSLVLEMAVNLAKWRAEMGEAAQISNTRMREIERNTRTTMSQMNNATAKFQNAFRTLGIGVSVGLVVNVLRNAAREAINYGDEMQKAAKRSGLAVGEFVRLAEAFKLQDVESDQLGKGLKRLQVVISQFGTGNKAAAETFNALGISFAQISKLKADEQLELIASRLVLLREEEDRTRAGVTLFGKQWDALAPVMLEGAAGIRAAREELERIGGTLTEEQVNKLADAEQKVKDMTVQWRNLTRILVSEVAPALIDVAQAMSDFITGSQEGAIRRQIELLRSIEKSGGGFVFGAGKRIPGGMYTAAEARQKRLDLERGLAPAPRVTWNGLDAGLMAQGAGAAGTVPGYPPGGTKGGGAAKKEVDALKDVRDAYADVLTAGLKAMEALQTPAEDQVSQYREMKFALEQLAITFPNMAAEAQASLQRLEKDWGFEDITITAEKLFPKEERDQLSVFFEEASRNVQDILAEFLINPFEEGLDGLVKSFGDMLARMAAEAVAADIAGKLFGTGGVGSGSGWIGSVIGAVAGSMGGNTAGTAAGNNLLGDFIVQGMKGAKGYATGGFMPPGSWGIVGENGPELAFAGRGGATISPLRSGIHVTQNFSIQAPTGAVSRATQQQVAAAASRGLAAAHRRNN